MLTISLALFIALIISMAWVPVALPAVVIGTLLFVVLTPALDRATPLRFYIVIFVAILAGTTAAGQNPVENAILEGVVCADGGSLDSTQVQSAGRFGSVSSWSVHCVDGEETIGAADRFAPAAGVLYAVIGIGLFVVRKKLRALPLGMRDDDDHHGQNT